MEHVEFSFRQKVYTCNINIISSGYPCFVFVNLHDKELINEFSKEVTIKTDGEIRLPKKDDHAELVELRQSIFDAIKIQPEFRVNNNRDAIEKGIRIEI
jgi:hypothetical protein